MRFRRFCKDVCTRVVLSARLLAHDSMAIAVFIASAVLFTFLCSSLNNDALALSGLPVGVINSDVMEGTECPTKYSLKLYEKVCAINSFRVATGSKEELLKSLSDGELFCVFEIKKGYEKQMLLGSEKDLITMYEPENSDVAMFLSDIFAGQIFSDLCTAKAYQQYDKTEKTKEQELSQEEFFKLADEINEEEDYTFVFDYQLVDAGGKEGSYQEMNNAIIYRQMIAGVCAILLSFVILFSYTFVCLEKESGIRKRRLLTGFSKVAEFLGTLPVALLFSMLLSVIFCLVICIFTKNMNKFPDYIGICFCYLLIMSLLLYVLCLLCKGIKSYQFCATALILFWGITGILYVVKDIIGLQTKFITICNPNCWFIQRIADTMIKKLM